MIRLPRFFAPGDVLKTVYVFSPLHMTLFTAEYSTHVLTHLRQVSVRFLHHVEDSIHNLVRSLTMSSFGILYYYGTYQGRIDSHRDEEG